MTPSKPATSVSETIPPSFPDIFKGLWLIHYRHGMNPGLSKGMYHVGDVRSAVERAKRHCEMMGYRYVFVRPFVSDLQKEEMDRAEKGDS